MKIIAILNQKGGTGKTTLTINIARCLQLKGHSVLAIDSDSQGSLLKNWHVRSGGEVFPALGISVPTLHRDVKSLKECDYVLIDGAGNVSGMTTSAAMCADFILIPVEPGTEPLRSSEDTLLIINSLRAPGTVKMAYVLTRCREGTNSMRETEEEILAKGYNLLPTRLYLREDHTTWQKGRATLDAQPKGKASDEIRSVTEDILEFINAQ